MKRKPSFLVISGVHKAGTTSIYDYLGRHDDIFTPLKKELHFFTPLIYDEKIGDKKAYEALFKERFNEKYLLDVSPSYVYGGQKIISRLLELDNIKSIILLRNPVSRFISFYKQGITTGQIPINESLDEFFIKSKDEFIRYEKTGVITKNFYNRALREGCYAKYIEDWIDSFGTDLKIIYFEELINAPEIQLNQIFEWLSLPKINDRKSFEAKNQSRKPKMQFLSTLASKIFIKNEEFFRKHKKLKFFLKSIYQKLNTTEYNQVDSQTIKSISAFYVEHNKQLYLLLEKHGYSKPDWI